MKLITVNRLMISCWSLFNAEVVFLFFETSFDLLLKVCLLFRIVRLAGVSCLCFSFFLLVVHIFFVGIYRYFWYLSLISFLVDYSLVFGIFWLDLINEFFPACWLVVLVVIVVVHYIYAYVRHFILDVTLDIATGRKPPLAWTRCEDVMSRPCSPSTVPIRLMM